MKHLAIIALCAATARMLNRVQFWKAQAGRTAGIISLLLLGVFCGVSCRPANPQVSLPCGEPLVDLLFKSDLRLTEHVMADEGGYGTKYVGGIFTRSTPERQDYYLIGMQVGGDPDIVYLGDRITVNKFYSENGYLMVDYQTPTSSNIISGVVHNNIQGAYCGTDGRYPEDKPKPVDTPVATPARQPDNSKYSSGGFTREQEPTIHAFLPNLKRWVASDDSASIGQLIQYPIGVSLDGEIDYTVKDLAEFQRLYPRIFHPQFKQTIAAIPDDDIFFDWRGVFFRQGEVWLAPGKGPAVKISAFHNAKIHNDDQHIASMPTDTLPPATGTYGAKLEEARKVIAAVQPEVIKTISYTREELDKLNSDFQDEYCMVIAPRIARLSEYIDPRAIHWFYADWDKTEELVFWTAGIVPTYWGPKHHIFVINTSDPEHPKIVASQELESPAVRDSFFGRIWIREYPTDNNHYLRAVFSCFYVGGSGSHYKNWEICYNKFSSKLKFHEFCTGFPIAFSADFFY